MWLSPEYYYPHFRQSCCHFYCVWPQFFIVPCHCHCLCHYHYTSRKACQMAHQRTNQKFLILREITRSSTAFVLDPYCTTNLLPGTYSLRMNKGIFLWSELGKQRGQANIREVCYASVMHLCAASARCRVLQHNIS
jgi:hypothetical protein